MGIITLSGIKLHAFHGCLPEERLIGGPYIVDIQLKISFAKAMESDELSHTVNYADINAIVRREMAIPSQLIEHVAGRILRSLEREITADFFSVKVTKLSPPLEGEVLLASVEIQSDAL